MSLVPTLFPPPHKYPLRTTPPTTFAVAPGPTSLSSTAFHITPLPWLPYPTLWVDSWTYLPILYPFPKASLRSPSPTMYSRSGFYLPVLLPTTPLPNLVRQLLVHSPYPLLSHKLPSFLSPPCGVTPCPLSLPSLSLTNSHPPFHPPCAAAPCPGPAPGTVPQVACTLGSPWETVAAVAGPPGFSGSPLSRTHRHSYCRLLPSPAAWRIEL